MLLRYLAFSLLFPLYSAIIDRACTTNNKFNVRSVNCANVLPDQACAALYGPPPTVDSEVDRSPACYTTGGQSIDHELKSLSSEICARQCGYCCQSPAYACSNAARPRVACDQVTHRMCRNPIWKDILTEDCPNVCGFCLKGCVDVIPDCQIDKTICRRMGMEQFVMQNCRRTCGYCTTNSANNASGKTCLFYKPDNNPSCSKWALNGFCENNYFDLAFKRNTCATTCKIC